jgi:CDP-glucose 4,6-dehydratase
MSWQDKRVLVTGVTGFLGSWLARELADRGASVVGLVRDRLPDSYFLVSGVASRITTVDGNVCDGDLMERILLEYEIEHVFHLAAQTIVGVANENPVSTFESNIRGTWTVLEAARRCGRLKGLVMASSDKAYGSQSVPYDETAPLLGTYPYDTSKVCQEYLARCYFQTYGLPVVITRCANLYGGGDVNFSRIVPGTIRSLLADERPIVRSDGSPVRDYLYVEDAVRGYLALAERVGERDIPGAAFNFGTSEPVSVLDLVEKIVSVSGKPHLKPLIQGTGKLQGEIDYQYVSADRAKQRLGWTPVVNLLEGLRETYHWYQTFLGARRAQVEG